MNKKIILISILLLSIMYSFSQYIPPENLMTDKQKQKISNIEITSGITLLIGSITTTQIGWENRQGIEIPLFTIGLILIMEGNRLKNTQSKKFKSKELRF